MPPQIENMVSTKKWKNQTLKLRIFKQFFYRKRRVVVNPPYHLMEDIMSEFQSEYEIKEAYQKELKRSRRIIVIFLVVVICLVICFFTIGYELYDLFYGIEEELP